ncbi:MAG: hypothetical protein LUQ65_09540 [Candidatus Helarchaeota archaeon]|nr:hypothetical protein [Candidatus Helarchaeota archaeon]
MKREKEFVSADLYLCAFLSIFLNLFPSFKVESGKTLFIFPADATLYEVIAAYNAGVQINAFEFAQQIKRLRGEMISRRGTGPSGIGMEKKNGQSTSKTIQSA